MDESNFIFIGKAGQFVAAVLQTAGLYSQSDVLRLFVPFFSSFGALIYLVGLLGAFFSVAIFGNYRNAAYLLVGPGLFAWMIFNTVETNGTTFQFGDRVEDIQMERQRQALEGSFPGYSTEHMAKVSWFYANFDRTVSYVVQRIVAVLIDTDLKKDLIELARERMLARVLQGRAVDPQFLSLFTLMLQGDCAEYIETSRLLSEKRYLDPDNQSQLYQDKQKLLIRRQELGASKVVSIISIPLLDYLKANGFSIPTSGNVQCQQVWDMTIQLLERESSLALAPTTHELEQFDVTWDTVLGDVQRKLCTEWQQDRCTNMDSAQLVEVAKRIVMAQMMKNTLATNAHSMFMSQVAGHGVWDDGNDHRRLMGDVVSHEQNSYRFLISYLAATIPYLQGLLLYVLSMMFPFFAIFLLLPGRYSSFMVWPFLWLWVKSWDVGYAIVFLFRELLWTMFPYVGQARGAENYDSLDWTTANPSYFLNLVYAGDPSSNATLYWTIIGCLTLSVPCLTAYLCLGASDLFNAFKMAFEEIPLGMQEDRRNYTEAMLAGDWDRSGIRHVGQAAFGAEQNARKNPGVAHASGGNSLFDAPARLLGISRDLQGDKVHGNYATSEARVAGASAHFGGPVQGTIHARNALLGRPNGLPSCINFADFQNYYLNSMQESSTAGHPFLREFSALPSNDQDAGRGGDVTHSNKMWGKQDNSPGAASPSPSD